MGMIKKEKPLDYSLLACQIIALVQITLCLDTSSVFEITYPTLMQRIKGTKNQALLREMLHCVSLMGFVCDIPDEETQEILSTLTHFISESSDHGVVEMAIRMWTFLSSIQPKSRILSESLSEWGVWDRNHI